ncbi:WD40 repeat domain-containing protein [Streptomyces boluensis]|uniref:WD40 repeat domain-containing protein n=1 Tax=Streptomyces boluensis TaxID=1775135 RepID=A0A964UMS8_9ACTN|nr:WD40 repeat domain-containing protein [Streptomyces boluensis]NBE51507.1 hypothetical protein [Streptomyces boluensis]
MTEENLLSRYSGHTHAYSHGVTPVVALNGILVTVSVDRDGVLWTCDLTGGPCAQRPLELDRAGPEDEWYFEVGEWYEGDDEFDDGDREYRPRVEVDPRDLADQLTVAHLDGRPVVLTGGARFDLSHPDFEASGGAVRVWDLATGRKVGKTITGHELGVTALTTVTSEQGLISVSSSEEGWLVARNLSRGGEPVARFRGSFNGAMGAGLVKGRPVAVTGGHDDFTQAWDLLSGEPIGRPLSGIAPMVREIALTEIDGEAVAVASGGPWNDNALHVWSLDTQERIGPRLTGHDNTIGSLATAVVAGRSIALTSSSDGLRVWDLARGEQLGEALAGHSLKMITEVDGVPVAVISSDDAIRLWDLAALIA